MEQRSRPRSSRPLVAARRTRRALRLPLPSDRPDVARQLARALAAVERPHAALVACYVLVERRVRGLSARAAADELGVSRQAFLSWERGRLPRLGPEVRRGVRRWIRDTLGGESMDTNAPTWGESMELRVRAGLASVRERDPCALDCPEAWARVAADALGIPRDELLGPRRGTRLVLARRSIANVMRAEGFTKTDVGRALNRHHSTVAHYCEVGR